MSVEAQWAAEDEAWSCYADIPIVYRTATEVMELVTCGEGGLWRVELEWLWTHDRHHVLDVLDSVVAEGHSPIILGNDGRLWDGHHRLAVALALDIPVPTRTVPAGA